MNLDSLTDLVSNAVGVLILLLLITALQSQRHHNEVPLPLEHQSGLTPYFFYLHRDRIQAIEINSVFTNGLLAASETGTDVEYQINADFIGRPDDALTLALIPTDTDRWPTLDELSDPGSSLAAAADGIDAKTDFAFLFVHDHGDGHSFTFYHQIRDWFLDRGIAVGWLPVTERNPAYLCSWSDVPACQYSPSYYALTR